MGGKRNFIKTRYRGVYYRESLTRQHAGKPDHCFVVWFADQQGKGHWHTVGWLSDGITEKSALGKRQELIQQLALGNTPGKQIKLTVGEAVKAYEEWARAEGKSIDKELSRYDKHLRHALHSLRIEIVTGAILTQLKSRLLVELAPGSVHHCFAFIRRAINHAISEGLYRGENPVASGKSGKFKMPQVQNCGERFFTPEEANLLLAELKCRSPQVHDMSLLSLKTGLRATEIFSIRGQDVRKATKEIFFTAKNGRRQSVHAPGDIIDILLAYKRKPGEFIFQATNGGPLLWGISDSFTRAVDKLKFNEGISDRRNRVWFHTWRHTFASWLAQSGKMTLHEIKEMLRHERIEMTERYSHLIPGHQASRLDIIDDTLKMGRKADEE